MRFGLFFFTSAVESGSDQYEVLLRAARYADEHGFAFVSTPERHFDPFGGLFPNPALTSAALAAVTRRIQIRAGSLVLPLHDVIRVVEDWAVVDNLSGGRVALSIGSGWNVNDFVLRPERYADRRAHMRDQLVALQKMWRTRVAVVTNAAGTQVKLRLYPGPVQKELPLWLTSSGSTDTFQLAGRLGCNVLTHVENQDLESLRGKIRAYRESRAATGLDANTGVVTLMQHCYVSDSDDDREAAEADLIAYLASALSLELASVRAGGEMSGRKRPGAGVLNRGAIRAEWVETAADRYASQLSLIGSIAECRRRISLLQRVGVDEIACLVDFVRDPQLLFRGLEGLSVIRRAVTDRRQSDRRRKALAAFLGSEH